MKRFICLLCALLMVMSSCEDFLKEQPTDFISPENFPASAEDADLLLAGAMNFLAVPQFYDRGFYFLAEVGSDHTQVSDASGERHDIDWFTYNADGEMIGWVWTYGYRVINNANILISKVPVSQMSVEKKAHYTGAAKFLRAFTYFHLVRLYGELPKITEPVQDFKTAGDIARSPVKEIYDQILEDLTEAEKVLPVEWTGMLPGRPDLASVKSLLADVYMTLAGYPFNEKDKWALALQKTDEVIKMNRYSLLPDFADLWLIRNKNGKEHIFSIQNHTASTLRSQMTVQSRPSSIGAESGTSLWFTSEAFMNTFDDTDLRKKASFLTEYGTVTYKNFAGASPHIKKWFDAGRVNYAERSRRTDTNIPVYRYADLLLMFAEAENEVNGPTAAAFAAINQVRARAGLKDLSGLTAVQLRDAIKQERSWELAFECKRRFDLVRWGDFMKVFSAAPKTAGNVKEHHMYYPVPSRDLLLNPNLKQNAGY